MRRSLLLGLALVAGPALAAPERDLCTDRPGLGSPPCTVEPGHVVVEVGLGDFTHQRDANQTVDEQIGLDTLLRIGVADHTEMQLGWSPVGHVRTRDSATGTVENQTRAGDVTLAVQRNLMNPDGSGTSIAVRPFVTLPVGRRPVGLGDWGAGIVVPMSFDLSQTVHLGLTPEVDAAVDQDGRGRHLAFGSVVGVGVDVTDAVSLTVEAQALRDHDPAGHVTEIRASLSAAWQLARDWQLDAGVVRGLNHATADIEGYFGVSRRF